MAVCANRNKGLGRQPSAISAWSYRCSVVCDSLHGRFFMDFPTSCPTSSFFFAHLLAAGKSATRVPVQLRPTAYGAGSAQPEEDLAESHRASANGPYLKGGGWGVVRESGLDHFWDGSASMPPW